MKKSCQFACICGHVVAQASSLPLGKSETLVFIAQKQAGSLRYLK
jgi:hypothetical protein